MSHAALQAEAISGSRSSPEVRETYRKITWRLLPFLFLAYAVNAIDRINISFAKLRMAQDLGLTDAAYAIGATAFFAGYILFEIPSNLYMQRVGARATLTRIMVLWGLVTALTCMVSTPVQLYIARFVLGIAEAGFFPGVILYMTYWFPSWKRGRITSIFFMAGFVAGMISGPLAGAIMTELDGWHAMKGWQTLFILEGIPAVLLGAFAWYWLDDQPRTSNGSPINRRRLSPTICGSTVNRIMRRRARSGASCAIPVLTFLALYFSRFIARPTRSPTGCRHCFKAQDSPICAASV